MASGCLDEGTVVAFMDGGLASQERSAVANHLGACVECADLMTWAAADRAHGSRSAGRDGRPFVGQLSPGSRVDRYQILGAVGRGGMGEVYAAYHPDLDRRIALKVVSESGANAPDQRARLLREARAIARLSHPNVVAIHDAGTVDGRVYIAMEFVEGETIDEWLRSKPRGWREIVDVFIAAGRGLAAAHAAGIIHRDFKPQNVMIGRDGSVRVMDFGLARLAEEPVETREAKGGTSGAPEVPPTVTKTGALLGTPAYMSPEQFRGAPLDSRADQFSFCVGLHEALDGSRPALKHIVGDSKDLATPPGPANAPAWLQSIVSRGLAEAPGQRFPSMNDLLGALVKGRTRPRRRAIGVSVALGVLLVAIGGWRGARGARINCAAPTDRLAAAWSGHDDARRQSIHGAFLATGRPTAETSWQRVAQRLDEYIGQWSAMYIDACEATNARGEQSSEVLDLRMSCLQDSLDQAKALTEVFRNIDTTTVGRTIAAAADLPAISRCADLSLLRSAVPLPRDQRTLDSVRALRTSLRQAQAMRDVGNIQGAGAVAVTLQARAEATGYGPLVAEVLELIASMRGKDEPKEAERMLHQALIVALGARDDVTAARSAADLTGIVGTYLGKPAEAEMWFDMSNAIVQRLGPGHERIRAWALNNLAIVSHLNGDSERAVVLAGEAVRLKERALGKGHPDVAISILTLANNLMEGGRSAEGLALVDQALNLVNRNGDPDSDLLLGLYDAKGDALVRLGRGTEAESIYTTHVLRISREAFDPAGRRAAFALEGIGRARLAQGRPNAALPVLEEALRVRELNEPIKVAVAEARFNLARALWESGRDRRRAFKLAEEARQLFETLNFQRRRKEVIDWLALHRRWTP